MQPDDPLDFCPTCGTFLEWTDCDFCGGEGVHEMYEADPLWYRPGDTEPCTQCGGDGGWLMCVNKDCAVGVVDVRRKYGRRPNDAA